MKKDYLWVVERFEEGMYVPYWCDNVRCNSRDQARYSVSCYKKWDKASGKKIKYRIVKYRRSNTGDFRLRWV